jgi:hypothetical protein
VIPLQRYILPLTMTTPYGHLHSFFGTTRDSGIRGLMTVGASRSFAPFVRSAGRPGFDRSNCVVE